jgi:malic enzyme
MGKVVGTVAAPVITGSAGAAVRAVAARATFAYARTHHLSIPVASQIELLSRVAPEVAAMALGDLAVVQVEQTSPELVEMATVATSAWAQH